VILDKKIMNYNRGNKSKNTFEVVLYYYFLCLLNI